MSFMLDMSPRVEDLADLFTRQVDAQFRVCLSRVRYIFSMKYWRSDDTGGTSVLIKRSTTLSAFVGAFASVMSAVTMASPSEAQAGQIKLKLLVEYPELLNLVPQWQLGLGVAHDFAMLRVYVDGVDIGSYKTNRDNEIAIPANGSVLRLYQGGMWGHSPDSNEVSIRGRARNGVLSVRCGPNLNPFQQGYWNCEVG